MGSRVIRGTPTDARDGFPLTIFSLLRPSVLDLVSAREGDIVSPIRLSVRLSVSPMPVLCLSECT